MSKQKKVDSSVKRNWKGVYLRRFVYNVLRLTNLFVVLGSSRRSSSRTGSTWTNLITISKSFRNNKVGANSTKSSPFHRRIVPSSSLTWSIDTKMSRLLKSYREILSAVVDVVDEAWWCTSEFNREFFHSMLLLALRLKQQARTHLPFEIEIVPFELYRTTD